MRVYPDNREVPIVLFVQIGERSLIHKAVTAENNNTIRCLAVNNLPGGVKLLQHHLLLIDTIRLPAVLPFIGSHGNLKLGRGLALRGKEGKEPGSQGIDLTSHWRQVVIASLPLRHQESDCFLIFFSHSDFLTEPIGFGK